MVTQNARRTGRTTRMIAAAEVQAREGKRVIIVLATMQHKNMVERMLTRPTTIRCTTIDELLDPLKFDQRSWKPFGQHDVEVCIDHFAWDCMLDAIDMRARRRVKASGI